LTIPDWAAGAGLPVAATALIWAAKRLIEDTMKRKREVQEDGVTVESLKKIKVILNGWYMPAEESRAKHKELIEQISKLRHDLRSDLGVPMVMLLDEKFPAAAKDLADKLKIIRSQI
jgi:hypothetical protein